MNLANTYFTIIYFIREAARSQKGASYARDLQMSVSAIFFFSSVWVWKSYFCGLDSCHREFNMNIYKVGMLCFTTIDLQSRSEQRKGTPLRKRTNTDHFRCFITIWSIGIARWLNEVIFVKTSNSTKTDIFHFFLPLKLVRAHSNSFWQHGSHMNFA